MQINIQDRFKEYLLAGRSKDAETGDSCSRPNLISSYHCAIVPSYQISMILELYDIKPVTYDFINFPQSNSDTGLIFAFLPRPFTLYLLSARMDLAEILGMYCM